MGDAIGMVETKGMVPLVHATDAMLKTANVAYKGWKKVGSGFCTVFVRETWARCRRRWTPARRPRGQWEK